MATTKNLVIDQGATFSANIQFLDTSKNPISLAGYSVRSKMRTSYDAANAATLTATVVNAATGNINLFLNSSNTSLLPHGRYVYDVEAYAGNTVIRVVEGSITVMPGVSGDSSGTILRQSISSLVNGNYTVSLAANGLVTIPGALSIPGGGTIINQTGLGIELKAGPQIGGYAGLASYEGNNYVWVDSDAAYIATNWNVSPRQWVFSKDGNVYYPDNTAQNTAYKVNNYITNRPAFRVYGSDVNNSHSSSANISLKGAALVVDYNQGNCFNQTTGYFTTPITGLYQVSINVSAFSGLSQVAVLRNNSYTAGNIFGFWEAVTIGQITHYGETTMAKLYQGDVLSANILTGNITFDAADNWSVTFIG